MGSGFFTQCVPLSAKLVAVFPWEYIMNWININTTFIRSPEFIGAEPVERATWLCLLAYCCEQENGGNIKDCNGWKCRRWQQTCGVSLEEVQADSDLWEWKEDCLSVFAYPSDKEREVAAKRKAGKRGGRPKTKGEKPHGYPDGLTDGKPHGSDLLKRKGKEKGKGKEVEEKSICPSTTPKHEPKKRKAPTKGSEQFEAWWKAYRRGGSKPNALKEWKARDLDGDLAEILRATAEYHASVERIEYCKHAERFLSHETYLQDFTPYNQPTQTAQRNQKPKWN